ncbi:hypothetical protein [Acaryochloris marina]|uniref:hypothetical protein n=1 Tax=Acaryochloris marina TaxID=155978 RepID=UPI0021C47BA0|nr:hypothetical protein [Acaryochloris marina]BDM79722.1 hypothetical protein AM10699_25900 [Acaryochloris marina MBIC10699]
MALPGKVSSIASLIALSMAAPAAAVPLQKTQSNLPTQPNSSFLIASPFRKEISPAYQRRKKLMEMLVMQMEISEMAAEFLKSDDPEVKGLAKEMMESSDNLSSRILNMLSPDKTSKTDP